MARKQVGAAASGSTDVVTVADIAAAKLVTESAQTANYTLVLADGGNAVSMSNASARTITVPPNSTAAFPVGTVIELLRLGSGAVTVVAGSGVTIRTAGGLLALRAQYSAASIRKRATNEWVLVGDLA
ncbi:hypothetical protein GCM10009775_04820 [Microbacterium aoyamense]|uniref:Uncharacterized protein n=1 Tax=Microbacterium aoyamense TaxID=344166 RepID=A0ABN2PBW4_9MICO|nr:hypothetical protein [Microbacterium aoyamense]